MLIETENAIGGEETASEDDVLMIEGTDGLVDEAESSESEVDVIYEPADA